MAEIITKDSEEFKELTGWMKKIGKSLEAATARIRPAIADEHYLQGEDVCEMLHISKRTLQTLRVKEPYPIPPSEGKYCILRVPCTRPCGKTTGTTGNTPDNRP